MSTIEVTLPKLCGTRWAAGQLAAQLGTLAGVHVIADARVVLSAAQGWCDEFVGQVVVDGGGTLHVVNSTDRMDEHIVRSARLRGVNDRVVVTPR